MSLCVEPLNCGGCSTNYSDMPLEKILYKGEAPRFRYDDPNLNDFIAECNALNKEYAALFANLSDTHKKSIMCRLLELKENFRRKNNWHNGSAMMVSDPELTKRFARQACVGLEGEIASFREYLDDLRNCYVDFTLSGIRIRNL